MAVDGGIGKKALQGFDFLLARAVAVCFTYSNGAATNVQHWPSRMPAAEAFSAEGSSEQEWNCTVSLIRQRLEAEAARKAIEHFAPDLVLMDGLLAPHPADRPAAAAREAPAADAARAGDGARAGGSAAGAEYQRALEAWAALHSTGTHIAGVVEDTRSTRFCEYVRDRVLSSVRHPAVAEAQELLSTSRDTALLSLLMERGQRTLLFDHAGNPALRDLPAAAGLRSFFLKTAQWDRPVRVDFLARCADRATPATETAIEAEADALAALLLAVSGQHAGYGMPAPLIEADNAARLAEHEVEAFYAQLLASAGPLPSLLQLRREERPF
ncbi:MAG TPA: DNA double-strand break repair nuclease NurA [archaeon]|nr:DNA double-strand break repair nuclease NurA [archaeon]